jgi:hypothetical protein
LDKNVINREASERVVAQRGEMLFGVGEIAGHQVSLADIFATATLRRLVMRIFIFMALFDART